MTTPDNTDLLSIGGWCVSVMIYIASFNVVSGLDITYKIIAIISIVIIMDMNLFKHWDKWKHIRAPFVNFFKNIFR